jgi:RimJ/RimL family protein N-acetyltransferase
VTRVIQMFVGPTTSIAARGLLLRVLGIGDAEAVVEATRDCADAVWVPDPPPYTVEQARSFLADYERRRQAGDAVSFGVFRPYDEWFLAGLVVQEAARGDIELAYWVRPEARRRRIATRSLDALSAWVEGQLAPRRVWVEVEPANEASLRTAAGAGYRRHGMRGGKVVLVRE